jgi:hypothetical protein
VQFTADFDQCAADAGRAQVVDDAIRAEALGDRGEIEAQAAGLQQLIAANFNAAPADMAARHLAFGR